MTILRCEKIMLLTQTQTLDIELLRSRIRSLPARQQPSWQDHPDFDASLSALESSPNVVSDVELAEFRSRLAAVANGSGFIIQAGDCAESLADSEEERISRRISLVLALGNFAHKAVGGNIVHVGRMGGQFAKPRSKDSESINNQELPSYRGDMVNGSDFNAEARKHDPNRMLSVKAASDLVGRLLWKSAARSSEHRVWSSHEALVLDYELSLLRSAEPDGRPYLSSTHWPWIGNRTNDPLGAHTAMLAAISNPVACKVGADMTADRLLELCARLDPQREPGRLTLISRIGCGQTAQLLPGLVGAVKAAGHPVIWLNDPMHGNTVTGPHGRKTRYLEDILTEVADFKGAVQSTGGIAGGLHLEATIDDVAECHVNAQHAEEITLDRLYTSLCDPRLTVGQAMTVIQTWCAA